MRAYSASSLRSENAVRDTNLVRLRCRETGQFLHLSGAGLVKGTDWAWLGTRAQAGKLRARAQWAGRDWPFRVVARGNDKSVGSIDA